MKWYDSILGTLRGWMRLDESATEAEIHAAMQKQNPLENTDELSQKLDAANTKADSLAAEVAQLKTTVKQLSSDMKALETRLAVVEKTPAEKQTGADTPPATPESLQVIKAWKKMPGLK